MKQFENESFIGEFFLSETPIVGQLKLNGEDSVLELHSKEFFNTRSIEDECIKGVLNDNEKVSLIGCLTLMGPGRGSRNGEEYHFSNLFPHFAIFGDDHIDSSEKKVLELQAFFKDATNLFYDFDAFSKVLNDEYDAHSVIKSVEEKRGRGIETGEYPMLFYYSGKSTIFKAETAIGDISAQHCPSVSLPSTKGIQVRNDIPLCITFKSGISFDEAITRFWSLLGFIDLIVGRPQKLEGLRIRVASKQEHPVYLKVYWCMSPNRKLINSSSRVPHPMDVLINGGINPNHFCQVLRDWLNRHQAWQESRNRFIQSFRQQSSYTIDRLVGAANVFDILPDSAVGEPNKLAEAVENICKESRMLWKSYPHGPERDSILNALGRVGKHNLKTKVESRAKILTNIMPKTFPDLKLVIDHAVDTRNFYVHGPNTKEKLTKEQRSKFLPFFTNTLEFIFGAADLIESGWDINTWAKQGSTLSHPYGCYLVGYKEHVKNLKKALG